MCDYHHYQSDGSSGDSDDGDGDDDEADGADSANVLRGDSNASITMRLFWNDARSQLCAPAAGS